MTPYDLRTGRYTLKAEDVVMMEITPPRCDDCGGPATHQVAINILATCSTQYVGKFCEVHARARREGIQILLTK